MKIDEVYSGWHHRSNPPNHVPSISKSYSYLWNFELVSGTSGSSSLTIRVMPVLPRPLRAPPLLPRKPTTRPLPANDYPARTRIRKAYQFCLALEAQKDWNSINSKLLTRGIDGTSRSPQTRTWQNLAPTVVGRVLGHALRLAPSEHGRNALTREILECRGNAEMLARVSHLYVYGLIRICEFR